MLPFTVVQPLRFENSLLSVGFALPCLKCVLQHSASGIRKGRPGLKSAQQDEADLLGGLVGALQQQ